LSSCKNWRARSHATSLNRRLKSDSWRKIPIALTTGQRAKSPLIDSYYRIELRIMLSEKIVAVITAMPYQSDAEWEVNILPFGSVYWKDEMPAIGDLFDKPDDMAIIFKIFGMRIKLWDGEALNAEDQQLWD